MPDMEFWLRSGILEKQGICNLIKSNAWDENSRCSDSFISGINIRFQIPCFFDRFLQVTRIPYPASPVYSIRERSLEVSIFFQGKVPFAIPYKSKGKGRFIGEEVRGPGSAFNQIPDPPCFSKIPERSRNSVSGISVRFYLELLNISGIS